MSPLLYKKSPAFYILHVYFVSPYFDHDAFVTYVPSVTNVYYFFMNYRDVGRFVRCGFVYVIVFYGAANCQCCRAPLFSRVFSVYGAAFVYDAALQCCRASLWPRVCGSAHSHTAAHTCCRAAWCRAPVFRRSPMVPRAAERYVVLAYGAAQFYVLPRI